MEETPVPPRASVIIVSFNAVDALRRCLAALEAAPDRAAFEVLVVDNGSTDGSAALEQEFAAVTFLKLPRNFGFTRALNIGMRTAKAELFFFLDPRVEIQGAVVTALAGRLEKLPEAVAAAPLLVTPAGEPAPRLFRLPVASTVTALARAGEFTPAAVPAQDGDAVPVDFAAFTALMVRAYFLKGLRYVDERYAQTWGDAEIALQIRRANRKVVLAPDIRVVMHDEPDPVREIFGNVLVSDWVSGAATYAGKHFGFLSGLKVRLAAGLSALAGLRLGVLTGIVSRKKLDGT